MRTAKKIDLIIQAVLMLLAFIAIPTVYLSLIIMFFLGIYQLVSAAITSTNGSTRGEGFFRIKYYWLMVAVYFPVLLLLALLVQRDLLDGGIAGGWFLSAWLIAGYYLGHTWKTVRMLKKQDQTLLNTNDHENE